MQIVWYKNMLYWGKNIFPGIPGNPGNEPQKFPGMNFQKFPGIWEPYTSLMEDAHFPIKTNLAEWKLYV